MITAMDNTKTEEVPAKEQTKKRERRVSIFGKNCSIQICKRFKHTEHGSRYYQMETEDGDRVIITSDLIEGLADRECLDFNQDIHSLRLRETIDSLFDYIKNDSSDETKSDPKIYNMIRCCELEIEAFPTCQSRINNIKKEALSEILSLILKGKDEKAETIIKETLGFNNRALKTGRQIENDCVTIMECLNLAIE